MTPLCVAKFWQQVQPLSLHHMVSAGLCNCRYVCYSSLQLLLCVLQCSAAVFTQGWLDTTYLSSDGEFRISKGNKGTMFVLVREQTPKDVRTLLVLCGATAAAGQVYKVTYVLCKAGNLRLSRSGLADSASPPASLCCLTCRLG